MRPLLRLIRSIAAVLTLLCLSSVPAYAAPEPYSAKAQPRDSVVDAQGNCVYMALYDRNEIWKVNPQTNETLAALGVGKGPVALAISRDGAMLACVNRLGNTATLVRLADFTIAATLPCGQTPCDVVALPGGRFAVANSFSDNLTVFAQDGAGDVQTCPLTGASVPNGIAASERFIGVIARVPLALMLFDAGTLAAAGSVALPEPPVAVTALPDGRFAVACTKKVAVVDPATAQVAAQRDCAALDVATNEGNILVLGGASVEVMSPALEPVSTIALVTPASTISAGNGLVSLLSPRARQWQMHGDLLPAAPAESQAVRAALGDGKQTPAQAAAGAAAQQAAEKKPPSPGHERPTSLPLVSDGTSGGITQAFTSGVKLNTEPGITTPDWTQPMRDIQADVWQHEMEGKKLKLRGNVHLQLDNTTFASDEFTYDETTGDMHAEGNVLMTQDDSSLNADEVIYRVPQEADLPPPAVMEPGLDEQGLAKKRLTLGYLEAQNVHILQPTREITADRFVYDLATDTGEAENARGHADVYYFGAKKLRILGAASADGEDVWVTTCDHDPPHYKFRVAKAVIRDGESIKATHTRLQFGKFITPIYWPVWSYSKDTGANLDFQSGHRAKLGYYFSLGQRFPITPDVALGYRLYPTTKEGIGLGAEGSYDFTKTPSSPLFLGKGEFHSLATTESEGYFDFYHRHILTEDTILLMQSEYWSEKDFYKRFFYDDYRTTSEPRTFANITHTDDRGFIATGTVSKSLHDWTTETEKLPEATFHLLERPIADKLYVSFDTINGYYNRKQEDKDAARTVNVARMTYDLDLHEALSITPFVEAEGSAYSQTRELNLDDPEKKEDGGAQGRASALVGATAQSRLTRKYDVDFLNFSGFKHLIVPSTTLSYRPDSSLGFEETPYFDAYDNVYGRSRIESKIDNIILGQDAETKDTWQVLRLTLYHGNDMSSELRQANDYEAELDIRPRPAWGFLTAVEEHTVVSEDLRDPFYYEQVFFDAYRAVSGKPYDSAIAEQYYNGSGDYDRLLSYFYYDDTELGGKLNAKLGFAYTRTREMVFNREVIYGLDYKLSENWSTGFEHRYDFERGELAQQKYEIRRRLHCWDMTLMFRERGEGWDLNVAFNLAAFPKAKLKF